MVHMNQSPIKGAMNLCSNTETKEFYKSAETQVFVRTLLFVYFSLFSNSSVVVISLNQLQLDNVIFRSYILLSRYQINIITRLYQFLSGGISLPDDPLVDEDGVSRLHYPARTSKSLSQFWNNLERKKRWVYSAGLLSHTNRCSYSFLTVTNIVGVAFSGR